MLSFHRSLSVACVTLATIAVLALNAVSSNAQALPKPSRFSSATLRIGVESYLRDRLEDSDDFEIGKDIADQVFTESFVVAHCEASPESLHGSTKIQIVFSKNDNVLRRVYIPVRITIKRNVPVATRTINKGDIVQSSDIEYRLTDVTYLNAAIADDVIGRRVGTTISKGMVISQSQLSAANGIQRGDQVHMVIRYGGVTVSATGTALDDAIPGQRIRVKKDDSQIIMNGVAHDNKTVELAGDASTAPSTSSSSSASATWKE